jgi:hypothetical protein
MCSSWMPSVSGRSHRKWSKPSALSENATRQTWEESIDCMAIPLLLMSQLTSLQSSFTASTSFFRMLPWVSRASNMIPRLLLTRG